jgi:hypothetical protein
VSKKEKEKVGRGKLCGMSSNTTFLPFVHEKLSRVLSFYICGKLHSFKFQFACKKRIM